MKLILPLVIVASAFCAQASHVDEMITLITESDLAAFQVCSSQNVFTADELVVLKNLNESVLDKRKTDWSLNHKKAMLDWSQNLLMAGMCFGATGRTVVKDYMGTKGYLEIPKSVEFSTVQFVSTVVAVVGLYCAYKFVVSTLQKREKFEMLYKNAILINTALELMLNQREFDK